MEASEEIIMEELEEGEVSSNSSSDDDYTPLERPPNSDDDYTPLERPPIYNKISQPIIQDSDSEELDHSSDADSDDSINMQHARAKKPKLKLKPKLRNVTDKKKKYDIWTKKVQEDVLSETLNSCDVTLKDRSRDVESYDYTWAFKHNHNDNTHKIRKQESGNSKKRTRRERNDIHCIIGRRLKDRHSVSRVILDLSTTVADTEEEIAKDIANKLCEEKEELIARSLRVVGKSKCFEVFKKTQEIELDGGLSVMNFSRRRTPGGVFLHLLKIDNTIDQSKKTELFMEDRKRNTKEKKKRQAQKWKEQKDKERVKLLPELLTKAELLIENRHLKEATEADVVNPPPTPETDCHENSCDGIDNQLSNNHPKPEDKTFSGREGSLVKYDDDFLDIGNSNMDFF